MAASWNPIPTPTATLSQPPPPNCGGGAADGGIIDYAALYDCHGVPAPVLFVFLAAHFHILAAAASHHFSPAVGQLAARLRLSPSTAAVTLLALGNGAPDTFASLAALRSGRSRTGLAAVLSAGAFVSAFVVGSVALHTAPFPVDAGPFVRDVFFYLLAVFGLFYVYLSAEIYLWQAVGMVAFYVFFVGLVFWMDLVVEKRRGRRREEEVELGLVEEDNGARRAKLGNGSNMKTAVELEEEEVKGGWTCSAVLAKIKQVWVVPVATLLKLTIPSTSPSEWNRFYSAANVSLCPIILLYSFSSYIGLDNQIIFLIPHTHFPIWSIVLFVSLCLAAAHFFLEKEPPESESLSTTVLAFIMSVVWISTMAGELLNCLSAIGTILELPPGILGLTVLAWGNSVGDLVADVAVAKAGQPAMAMAGCFAGPMFNMLVGLGTALVIETANAYPAAYELRFHIGIVVAFVFLLLSLMGSLLVVTWSRFRVPRFWGFCLVGLYLLFTTVSILIAKFSG